MTLGLRGKILLIAVLVVVGTVGAIAATSSYFFTQQSTKAYVSRSLAIAKGLAIQLERILALGIEPGDLQGFEVQCAEAVERYKGLSYAMVVARDGTVLFHNDPERMGQRARPAVLDAFAIPSNQAAIDDSDHTHALVEPVRSVTGETVAYVAVGFPRSIITHERNQLLLLTVAVGLSALLVGLLSLFAALSYQVVRPISRFVESIKLLRSGGQYGAVRISPDGDDELGIMVNGFNELLDRIAAREQDLLTAKEAAEAANSAKSQFLAVMSHELRTPLSAVLGMTELLLRTPLDAKQERFAQNVKTSGKALLALINDILDFSRIEAGKVAVCHQPFDLRRLVAGVVEPFQKAAHDKKLELTLAVDPTLPETLIGDAGRIGQILSNLIANAVKFTEHGGITVTVSPGETHVRFCVSDTGIGIAPEFIDHIYEAFRQADGSQTRRYGGTGLGLAIVKQLTNALGGQIQVRSRVGQGSSFWLDLPLEEAGHAMPGAETAAGDPCRPHQAAPEVDSRPPRPQLPATPTVERRRILLAEDNQAHQELIALYLDEPHYALTIAATGQEALDRVTQEAFDLVLMDWQLPGLDGLQATQAIRQHEQEIGGRRTPIIALTAHAFQTDRAACLAAGMDDYLSKPFARETLLSLVEHWLGR